MKKGWKIFWVVCAVVAAIGVVCCVAAWGLGVTKEAIQRRYPYGIGWVGDEDDAGHNSRGITTDKEESFDSTAITELDVELSYGQLNVYLTEEEDIRVETSGISDRLGFQCYVKGNELKLTTKKKVVNVENLTDGTIDLYIPRDMKFSGVSLDIGAGTLYVEEILAQELSVTVGAGQAVVDAFEAADVDFECGAGEITAKGTAQEIDIECGIGEVSYTAAGYETDYNYDIECGIGEVVCGNSSYSGMGSDRSIDNRAGKSINIECGIGSVSVYFDGEDTHHNIDGESGEAHDDETHNE